MKIIACAIITCVLLSFGAMAQSNDSIGRLYSDSVPAIGHADVYRALLDSNHLVNTTPDSVYLPELQKKNQSKQPFFYFLAGLLLLLGLFKTFYPRYFTTLFRVFFNTSLRQSQLTDQLIQARLPSFLFNIYFYVVAGTYLYFLAIRLPESGTYSHFLSPELCVGAVAVCYTGKYLSLRFAGWVTNYRHEAAGYVFIIFLLNKVIGILLLPFLALIIFGSQTSSSYVIDVSLLLVAVIIFTRFFRSRAMLQHQLRISLFHFVLYIVALEILPLMLIYKAVSLFLGLKP